MDSIRIDTGEKRISINDDPNRVIVFNPNDALFVERFYHLVGELDVKIIEYEARSKEIDSVKDVDENGVPVNIEERISFLKESCEYFKAKIDQIFGENTSQTAFGDTLSLDVIVQFIDGITPFIGTVRKQKIEQYINAATGKKNKHKK